MSFCCVSIAVSLCVVCWLFNFLNFKPNALCELLLFPLVAPLLGVF